MICVALTISGLLEERLENVYKADPRFNDKATSLFNIDLGPPEALPDALRGEKWAFVQLPLGPLMDMLQNVGTVSRCAPAVIFCFQNQFAVL